jgi:transglutaminase-like putative cysteine protease
MKKKLYDIAPLLVSSVLSAAASHMIFKTFAVELSFVFCLLWALAVTFSVYIILINKKVAIAFFAMAIIAGVIIYFRLEDESREIIADFFNSAFSFISQREELPIQYGAPFGILLVAMVSVILILPAVIFPFFPALLAICVTLILVQWGKNNTEKLLEASIMMGALIVFFAHSMHFHADRRTKNVRNASAAWLMPIAVVIVFIIVGIAGSSPLDKRWEWLELRANIIGDYFSELSGVTAPRTIFDLSKTGYQPLGARLGGPVDLSDSEVMKVRTQYQVLLRGNIKNTYTGNSWIDDASNYRSRMTDRYEDAQAHVFNLNLPPEDLRNDFFFDETDIFISPSINASSTVFAPIRVIDVKPDKMLTMLISFNTEGEVFSSRDIDSGISYTIRSEYVNYRAGGFGEYVASVQSGLSEQELEYPEDIAENYLQPFPSVPENINQLAFELTDGLQNDYQKAIAIKSYMENGFTYTLSPGAPPEDVDFVEYFLQTREGYCTYFASAMVVLGRGAGLPTRYVEGFKTLPGSAGKTQSITGENAHAWAEIFIKGFGWIPFEPETSTAGTQITESVPDFIPEEPIEEDIPEPELPLEEPQAAPFDFTPIIIALSILAFIIIACLSVFAVAKMRVSLIYIKRKFADTNKIIMFYYMEIMVLMVYLKYEKPIGITLKEYSVGVDSRIKLDGVSFADASKTVSQILYAQKQLNPEDLESVYGYHRSLLNYIKTRLGKLRYFSIMVSMMFNGPLRKSVLPF